MMKATMTARIILSTVVAFVVAASPLVFPSDPFSQLVAGVTAAFLCLVPLFVLSRAHFVKSAASSVQTLISVLICLLALSAMVCLAMSSRIASLHNELDLYKNTPAAESS